MNSGIYTIENLLNGKLYVGYAVNFKEREAKHWSALNRNTHKNPHLKSAVRKYGIENFKFEVLVECEEKFLKSEEHYWCMILNTHDREYGYNEQPTNPNGTGRWSEEGRKNLSEKAKGRKPSPETLQIMRERKLGHKQSPETVEKRMRNVKGRKQSQEEKDKRAANSKITKAGRSYLNQGAKAILQYTEDGEFVKEWISGTVIVKATKYSHSAISNACNNKRVKKDYPNKYNGYIWKFK